MITTTLLKAADVALESMIRSVTEEDMDLVLKEVGVGPMALESMSVRIVKEFGDDPEVMVMQSLLVGILAERFLARLARGEESAFEGVQRLVAAYPSSDEDAGMDFIRDMADMLYVRYDMNLPEDATGEEVIKTLQGKMAEDSEGQKAAKMLGDLLAQAA